MAPLPPITPLPLPPPPPPPIPEEDPERAEVLVDDVIVARLPSPIPPVDRCVWWAWPAFPALDLSPAPLPPLPTGTWAPPWICPWPWLPPMGIPPPPDTWVWGCLVVAWGAFNPGLGIPLEGVGRAVLSPLLPPVGFVDPPAATDFPPLGIRLAILEDFLPVSADPEGSLPSSFGGVLALPPFPLLLSSFSLVWVMDLPLPAEPLPDPLAVEKEEVDAWAACMPAGDEAPPSRLTGKGAGGQISSPYSDRSSSSCSVISAMEGDVREAERGLIRRNLSSMERWLPGALAAAHTDEDDDDDDGGPFVVVDEVSGIRKRSDVPGGGGDVVGLNANMEEVALCLRFMDLLRQDFEAVGEGMAEPSWFTLALEGIAVALELPFMPPTRGMPLTDSLSLPLAYCRGLLLSILLKLWLLRLRLDEPWDLAPLPAVGTRDGPGNLVLFFWPTPIPLCPGGLV